MIADEFWSFDTVSPDIIRLIQMLLTEDKLELLIAIIQTFKSTPIESYTK